MTLAESQTSKPNGQGLLANMRLPSRETLQNLARSPKVSLPLGKKRIQLATDRVRAAPAVTPTLSGMIGMTALSLGVAGLFFPKAVARSLGITAPAPVVQSVFGLRELWSGYSLVGDPTRTDVLWARVAGDVFDIAALRVLDRPANLKRGNARLALGFVLAVTALDVVTAVRMSTVKRNCE
ncbi:MAG: hypothetical protein JWQ97_851 [Phenylobacterium sp.]|nr:hypothetical protein [Phenylobacterium sp.]